MPDFRYAQFCPIARVAELLGHRWNLLILRELLIGPQRFSDLARRLAAVSSSVLAERLNQLEERGVVRRRTLEPPAASAIYELTAAGHAIRPAFLELARWGMRFMTAPEPDDQFEIDWLPLGLMACARTGPTPRHSILIHIADERRAIAVHVAGGPEGTRVEIGEREAQAILRAPPIPLLGIATGQLPLDAVLASGVASMEGDAAALAALPSLFDFPADSQQSLQPNQGE